MDRGTGHGAQQSRLLRAERYEHSVQRRVWLASVSGCTHSARASLRRRRSLWRKLRSSRPFLRRCGNEKRHHCSGNASHAATDWRVENRSANADGTAERERSSAEFLDLPFRFTGEDLAAAGYTCLLRLSVRLY